MEEAGAAILAEGMLQRRQPDEEARPRQPQGRSMSAMFARGARHLIWAVALLVVLWAYSLLMGPLLLAFHYGGWISDQTYKSLVVAPMMVWVATAALGLAAATAASFLFCIWLWDSTPAQHLEGHDDEEAQQRERLRHHGRVAALVWGV